MKDFPLTDYRSALKIAWVEVFDSAPVLGDLPPSADYRTGVRLHGRNLAIAKYVQGWVVGHMTPSNEFQAATPPTETVEETIAALLGIVANTKAMAILYCMDVRE
mgnify:CR=1 FL=1|jgi:hypothetical protein